MNKQKTIVLGLIILGIVMFFAFDLGQYLTLDYFNNQRAEFESYRDNNPWQAATIFFVLYVLITALSLPAAAIITLIGGALFGLVWGTVLVSFASTIGATLAFLASRTILRESMERKFSSTLSTINEGMRKEGSFYLFGLRLVPLFPFFMVNLVMGLTQIPTRTFFFVSQLGMLPGTIVFVNAGTELGQIQSLEGILSPALLLSFVLLGIFPLIAKRIMSSLSAKKVLKPYDKPSSFDTNLVAIGAGSAGLVTSYIAAATHAKVTLIEKHKMGGDCLNTGCVPSKALIRSSKMMSYFARARSFGIEVGEAKAHFAEVMDRVQQVIHKIEPHDSVERYTDLGVDCVEGEAEIIDPYRVKVGDQIITTKNIVIATGARPFVPPIENVDSVPYFTSDTIWGLREQPEHLLVIGGGPIGCELTQSFRRLGSEVTQLDIAPGLMPREDEDVASAVQDKFANEGIHLKVGYTPIRFEPAGDQWQLICKSSEDQEEVITFSHLLMAVGRRANTEGFGLENLGIETRANGTIEVNEYLQTRFPNIYACGDVAGPYQFTHSAAHQAWYASVNALFGSLKMFKADYRVIPFATFTDPEVARVGLNEREAKEQGIEYEKTVYEIDDLDRAIADSEDHGFIKVLTVPGKDKILGVTIVGHHAGELIAEYVTAMKYNLGLNKILGTIHIYPTLTESNKYVAGEWKRNHVPAWVAKWLPKFHAWKRKG